MSYLPRAAETVVVQTPVPGEQSRARIEQFRTSPDPREPLDLAV
jgi:hypothetical protein